MRDAINRAARRIPVWAIWLGGAVPLALLVWDTITGAVGVDPIPVIEHRLGRTALYLLIASLMVTPLLRLGRINLMRFRRALGLLCFSYAALHVLAWIWLDMGLRWGQMAGDVVKRPYLLFGMTAFLALTALAVTSNDASVRRLRAGWRRLHRLVYPAALLIAAHWLWALKTWQTKPLAILALILFLLALRLPILQRSIGSGRRKNNVKTVA